MRNYLNMNQWQPLFTIVLIQFAIFASVAYFRKNALHELRHPLIWSAGIGIVIGIVFDLLIGRFGGIFTYTVAVTPLFLIVNGVFSYGLGLATSSLLPITFPKSTFNCKPLGFALVIIAGIILFNPMRYSPVLIFGITILLAGEGIIAITGYFAPLVGFFFGSRNSFFKLWSSSIAIGLLYETANSIVHLWRWQPVGSSPAWLTEILVVVFGYFVLIHAMCVIMRLVTGRYRFDNGASAS